MSNNNNSEKKNDVDKIEWLGMDGFLVAAYFAVVLIIWFTITHQNDLLAGYLIPGAIIVVVTCIFINYFKEVFKFMKK